MALEIKQELRLSQQLVMTPQLQQAIKLLQLSRLELAGVVEQELQENPVLEETLDLAVQLRDPLTKRGEVVTQLVLLLRKDPLQGARSLHRHVLGVPRCQPHVRVPVGKREPRGRVHHGQPVFRHFVEPRQRLAEGVL